MRVDEIHRDAYVLQLGRGFRGSRYAHAQHQVGMKGENGFDRGLYQATNAWLLHGFGRMGGVITDRHHIVSRPQCEHRISNAGQQADDSMRVVGHRDCPANFIRDHAAGLGGDGGRQQDQQQQSPAHDATAPLSTNGKPATSKSTSDATRATRWFISPNRSRKRRPVAYSGTTPIPTSFETRSTEQGGDCRALQRASIEAGSSLPASSRLAAKNVRQSMINRSQAG